MLVKDKITKQDPELRKAEAVEGSTAVSRSEGFDEVHIEEKISSAIAKMKLLKFVRQPDVELELDAILAETIKEFERENAEYLRQLENNNLALAKLYGKILRMNGLQLRHQSMPKWKPDTYILCVPVPDVPNN
jgi:hypothetical protein